MIKNQVAIILKGTKIVVTEAKWENGKAEYRVCLDKPTRKYKEWVEDMKGAFSINEGYEYHYDEGIAP